MADINTGLTPHPAEETPTFTSRFSEMYGTAHPYSQLTDELHQLGQHPIQTLYNSAKGAVTGIRDLAYNATVHPSETARRLTGGDRAADDYHAGRYGAMAGTFAGGASQVALMALGKAPSLATSVEEASLRALPKAARNVTIAEDAAVPRAKTIGEVQTKPISTAEMEAKYPPKGEFTAIKDIQAPPTPTDSAALKTASENASINKIYDAVHHVETKPPDPTAAQMAKAAGPLKDNPAAANAHYENFVREHPEKIQEIQQAARAKHAAGETLTHHEEAIARRPDFNPKDPDHVQQWAKDWANADKDYELKGSAELRRRTLLDSAQDPQKRELLHTLLGKDDWSDIQHTLRNLNPRTADLLGDRLVGELTDMADRGVAEQHGVHAESAHILTDAHGAVKGVGATKPAFDAHEPGATVGKADWGWDGLNPQRREMMGEDGPVAGETPAQRVKREQGAQAQAARRMIFKKFGGKLRELQSEQIDPDALGQGTGTHEQALEKVKAQLGRVEKARGETIPAHDLTVSPKPPISVDEMKAASARLKVHLDKVPDPEVEYGHKIRRFQSEGPAIERHGQAYLDALGVDPTKHSGAHQRAEGAMSVRQIGERDPATGKVNPEAQAAVDEAIRSMKGFDALRKKGPDVPMTADGAKDVFKPPTRPPTKPKPPAKPPRRKPEA